MFALIASLAYSVLATLGAPAVLVTLGDSITDLGPQSGNFALPSEKYPSLLAKDLGATLYDLGISGETASAFGRFVLFNGGPWLGPTKPMEADEMPNFPAACAAAEASCYVTIYIGTNDEVLAGSPTAGFAPAKVAAAYAASLPAAVAAVRSKAPFARIFIATIPNHGVVRADPPAIPLPNPDTQAVFALVRSFKSTIEAIPNITVVDLLCDPAMYDPKNFNTPYDVHPNARGHRAIERAFLEQMHHATPPAPCAYETAR